MGAHDLSRHNGRVTERTVDRTVEQIKASDILKLVAAVDAAAGLYNALEGEYGDLSSTPQAAFDALGEKLRELGLREVQP